MEEREAIIEGGGAHAGLAEAAPRKPDAKAVAVRDLAHAPGGFLHGLRQPFLQAGLRFDLPTEPDWVTIDEAFRIALPEAGAPPADAGARPLAAALARIMHWTTEFQRSVDDAVFESARVLWQARDPAELTVIAFPTCDADIATAALNASVALIDRGLTGASTAGELAAAIDGEMAKLAEARSRDVTATQMKLFLKAAHERGVPFLRLGTSWAFQLGYGARSRWMDCSFTDATPAIGASLARNKAAAASTLRQIGLPGAEHVMVQEEDAAAAAAQSLGYPVVVKPLDLDGGKGVFAGLKTEAAVRKAFRDASELSKRILVEKFFEGRDFRMSVMHYRLISVVERVPGGVTGDGVSTVRQLVDQLNADPARGDRKSAALKKLIFNDEAVALLAERGMDGDSVPAKGERIRLRGAANVASGGYPIQVLDQTHPDNRFLAEQIARAFRLDLIGIDVLISDIGRSWKEVGALVCEVNAQPEFSTTSSPHIFGQIIEALIQGNGRIPIGLLVGAPPQSRAAALAERILGAAGAKVGLASRQGVRIGGDGVIPGPIEPFTAARALLGDDGVEAALLCVDDASPSRTGLPFDVCHVVALAGSALTDAAGGAADFESLARSVIPMSGGAVALNAHDPACAALAPHVTGARLILFAEGPEAPGLVSHRSSGGAAVWIESDAEGACLAISPGGEAVTRIALEAATADDADDAAYGALDLALAVSVAGAMGCDEGHLRRGLAGARLRKGPA